MSTSLVTSQLPVVLDDVQVRAGETVILDGISLRFAAGPPTVLIGPNGSGKSTLLRLAMGLVPPLSGRISWGGSPATGSSRRALVFQRPVMLRRTAAGNLHFALASASIPREHRRSRVHELLRLVGLEAVADRPARRLSGGEQQRLALARALARDPEVLFLDEPTASLDPRGTKAIEEVIRTLAERGIKIVMATHDLSEAKRLAGEIVLLHRGCVVETGPADTFFAGPSTSDARRFLAGELLV
jgi:tungstate transport system ATP-binding protein